MNFNKVMIAGNLTRDPELRFTPKGTAVCQISLAINKRWKDEAGQEKEEVTFVECSAFGKSGEAIAQYFKKGRPIFVEGRLKLDTWDDKTTGSKRSKLSVAVESFQFCDSKPEGSATNSAVNFKRDIGDKPEPMKKSDHLSPPLEDDFSEVPF